MQSKQLIIGQKYKKILNNALSNVIWIPDNPYVDERLSGHADLSVFNSNDIIYAHSYLQDVLNDINVCYLDINMGNIYPNDVCFNASLVGNSIFLNETTVAEKILSDLKKGKRRVVHVKQGYTNCSILPVDNNSLITSDKGISEIAILNGFNVLEISPGYITLEGFDYGFIGGCGFLLDDSNLCFTGNPSFHPDYEKIKSFCRNLGVYINCLTNLELFDIGSAIKAGP